MPVQVIFGTIFMTLALILYAVGILTMVVKGRAKRFNVILLACASLSDITGTTCMIIYSGTLTPADWHGWFGYGALLLMLINLVLVFYHLPKKKIPNGIRVFDVIVFLIWLFSYSLGFMKLG